MPIECPGTTRLKGLAHPFKPHNLFVQRVVDLVYLEIYNYIYIYIYIIYMYADIRVVPRIKHTVAILAKAKRTIILLTHPFIRPHHKP